MNPKVRLAILLAAITVALGQNAAYGSPTSGVRAVPAGMHPAVVRVISPERNGMSLGSGTLVASHSDHGLVLTNWHVVSDAAGQIQVVFPDGFRSPATVLKTDRNWDLAALAIWRPNASPVKIASQPPRPGDPLTIAGYGSGRYRTASGWCTQYVSPGRGQPFEMVEVSTAARQGDSGGPIFNAQGELAGVLFGSGLGSTAGSYCGRVQNFLTPVWENFQRLQPNPYMIAHRMPEAPESAPPSDRPSEIGDGRPPAIHAHMAPDTQPSQPNSRFRTAEQSGPNSAPWQPPESYWSARKPPEQPLTANAQPTSIAPPVASIPARPSVITGPPQTQPAAPPLGSPASFNSANPQGDPGQMSPAESIEYPGSTLGEQLKTLLAAIGGFAILFHSLRLLATEPETKSRK